MRKGIKNGISKKVNKKEIPTCDILGVHIAAVNMPWVLDYLNKNIHDIKGDYICLSNVHTTVMSYEDSSYLDVQNHALMALPDGGPLSSLGRKRGYSNMERVAGPDLMHEVFEKGYKHYFYGSTEETLTLLKEKLEKNYPNMTIGGMYSHLLDR